MVMLRTSFKYKKDDNGFYREVLADGNLSKKRFRKLENLSSWVMVKLRFKICGFIFILALIFAIIHFIFEG